MLRRVKGLRGYAIRATDGVIGEVDDLYFNDDDRAIPLSRRGHGQLAFWEESADPPVSVGHPDWMGQLLPVSLTKAQAEHRWTRALRSVGNR